MKMAQAWTWLTAGVLAAGLNATYHEGGLRWAHRVADQIEHNTNAVLALATGRADQFLAEARWVKAQSEEPACPWQMRLAQAQQRLARSDAQWHRLQAIADRKTAELARMDARRVRMETQWAQIRVPAMDFHPVEVPMSSESLCSRTRWRVPRTPQVTIPVVPQVHVESAGTGPV